MLIRTSFSWLTVTIAACGVLLLAGCEPEGTATKPKAVASPTAPASNTQEICLESAYAHVELVKIALKTVGNPNKDSMMRTAYRTLGTELQASAAKATDSSLRSALDSAAKAAAAAGAKPKPEVKDPQVFAASQAVDAVCAPKD